MDEAAKQYASRFSDAELKELVTFFKAPLGQKMLVQEPQVLDSTFGFVQQWGPRVAEEVMNRFRAEMKKKGHNLPKSGYRFSLPAQLKTSWARTCRR